MGQGKRGTQKARETRKRETQKRGANGEGGKEKRDWTLGSRGREKSMSLRGDFIDLEPRPCIPWTGSRHACQRRKDASGPMTASVLVFRYSVCRAYSGDKRVSSSRPEMRAHCSSSLFLSPLHHNKPRPHIHTHTHSSLLHLQHTYTHTHTHSSSHPCYPCPRP